MENKLTKQLVVNAFWAELENYDTRDVDYNEYKIYANSYANNYCTQESPQKTASLRVNFKEKEIPTPWYRFNKFEWLPYSVSVNFTTTEGYYFSINIYKDEEPELFEEVSEGVKYFCAKMEVGKKQILEQIISGK